MTNWNETHPNTTKKNKTKVATNASHTNTTDFVMVYEPRTSLRFRKCCVTQVTLGVCVREENLSSPFKITLFCHWIFRIFMFICEIVKPIAHAVRSPFATHTKCDRSHRIFRNTIATTTNETKRHTKKKQQQQRKTQKPKIHKALEQCQRATSAHRELSLSSLLALLLPLSTFNRIRFQNIYENLLSSKWVYSDSRSIALRIEIETIAEVCGRLLYFIVSILK